MVRALTVVSFVVGGVCGWRWARGVIDQGTHPPEVTRRQAEILALVARGMSSKEIAIHEGISPYSVDTHIRRARSALGVSSRAAAAALVSPRRSAPSVDRPLQR
jgi:DNA-binding CsgD family transcriptional regulator